MRIAVVRSDIQNVYLSDVENSSQRDFSSQPKGQSRYLSRPSDQDLLFVLNGAKATIVGSNTGPFNTSGANAAKLNVRTSSTGSYIQVTVTAGASVTAAQIASDLNREFVNAGIPAVARVVSDQVYVDTVAGGPSAYVQFSASSPSTAALQTVLGLSTTGVSGVTLSAFKSAVYPTATTANVASATILALGSLTNMSSSDKTALVAAVQGAIAPRVVETGPVLRSYAYGVISKLRSSSFRPGGSRVGLPAGVAAYILEDDGSTAFTV